MTRRYHICWQASGLALFCLATTLIAADWPTFRHDSQRTGITEDLLTPPLKTAWTYHAAQPPAPAWGEQPKLLNRIDFDYAPQLVAADGMVWFGSSADDTVRALSLATGQEVWHRILDAPIRFAPQYDNGRLYVADDAGIAWCLDASTGTTIWRFSAAPFPDRMVGNHRVISRWPSRSGILVHDGLAYVTAGLWPNDGIYIYALDAETGAIRWVEDSLGFQNTEVVDSITGNHQGEFGFSGASPQGALLVADGVLVIPQGHANPFRLNAADGSSVAPMHLGEERGEAWAKKMLDAREKKNEVIPPKKVVDSATRMLGERTAGRPGSGGTWMTVDNSMLYVLAMHRGRATYLNSWNVVTGEGKALNHSNRVLPQIAAEGINRTVAPGRVSVVVNGGKIIGRNAYDLILAGELEVQGHDGAVSLYDPEAETDVWRAPVSGEARGLAVIDGALLVSTRAGEIHCFVAEAKAPAQPLVVRNLPKPATKNVLSPAHQTVLEQLAAAEINQGYCLVLGSDAEALARKLVAETEMQVIVALTDESAVADIRERLLQETTWYGTRLHVQHLPQPDRLTFAQYFANAVIVTGDPKPLKPTELYRVLRPCGGLLLLPDLDEKAALATLTACGALENEIKTSPSRILRDQLPLANDYNNPRPDPLVKWPLQTLWYGGPNPMDLPDDVSGEELAKPPTVANGLSFTRGANKLICYDAYNGTVRWSRTIPKMYSHIREYDGRLRILEDAMPIERTPMHWRKRIGSSIAATAESVFLTLFTGHFDEQGNGTIRLDPRDGKQLGIDAPYVPGPSLSLLSPLVFNLPFEKPREDGNPAVNRNPERTFSDRWQELVPMPGVTSTNPESGLLTITADDEGLVLEMTTTDPIVTDMDRWELHFDFRPHAQRYGLYGKGTFHLDIVPAIDADTPVRWVERSAFPCPELSITGSRTKTGTETTLRLSWAAVAAITGAEPESFGFAASLNALNTTDNPKEKIRQVRLLCDAWSPGLNVGWANLFRGETPPFELEAPAIIEMRPKDERGPEWTLSRTMFPRAINNEHSESPRIHPLTGESGPKLYRTGTWACGGPSMSGSAILRRASQPMVGVYDFEEDGGLHFISGIEASCSTSSIAALGILNYREARFRCDCAPPIRTTFAMAPAERKYNENWSIFYEHPMRSQTRMAHINIGAFGDRRESPERLWLAVPRDFNRAFGYPFPPGRSRPVGLPIDVTGFYMQQVPAGLEVPMDAEWHQGLGPYRRNSDRSPVAGTDKPWVYGSGIMGVKRLQMTLDTMRPMAAPKTTVPISLDGHLDEADWQASPTAELPNTKGKIWLRHDDKRLYIGVSRPAMTSALGTQIPWEATTSGNDAEVWKDDALEIFLANRSDSATLHLGVSASGARFDARGTRDSKDDPTWNGTWQSAVSATDSGLNWEIAIPFSSLKEGGLLPEQLAINVMIDQSDTRGDVTRFVGGEGRNWRVKQATSESLFSLGSLSREGCSNFAPLGLSTTPEFPTRHFQLTLHFAELDDNVAGRRQFDVTLNGKPLIKDLDIVAEAGTRTALAKTFPDVELSDQLILEFHSKSSELSAATAPMISGLELTEIPAKTPHE